MAVEILERSLGVEISHLSGGDVAYDVHLRRVFLRTGLAERDDVNHMVAVARSLYPARPGALDNPAWDIGRRWCHRTDPECGTCPLVAVCPRLIDRGSQVRGV
jgi:endonuclease III